MKKRTRRMTRNKLSLTFLFVWRDAVINSDHEAIFLERFIFSPNVFNVNIAIVFFFFNIENMDFGKISILF